jgi:hypothetical protein
LKQIEKLLSHSFEGLDVEAKVLGTASDRWVQIALSGEDEAIASNYLAKKTGYCPASLENVKRFSTMKGYVTNLDTSKEEVPVDIGVFEPEVMHATIPLHHLQAQLADGRKTAVEKIAELFGFCKDLVISVKIVKIDKEGSYVEAELSPTQIEKYVLWREALLDKLIILGSTLHDVRRTLNFAKLDRDVIDVEPMGMFEHVLTCKLGTDAAGLISRIGKNLRRARFSVFNPRRIREYVEEKTEVRAN